MTIGSGYLYENRAKYATEQENNLICMMKMEMDLRISKENLIPMN